MGSSPLLSLRIFFFFSNSFSISFFAVVVMESCVCIIDRLFQDWIEWIHFYKSNSTTISCGIPVTLCHPNYSGRRYRWNRNRKKKIRQNKCYRSRFELSCEIPYNQRRFFFFFNFVCSALSNFNTAVAHPHLTVQENKNKNEKKNLNLFCF